MKFIELIKKAPNPIKKNIVLGLKKIGYSKINEEFILKYKNLIIEAEGLYKEFLFKDFISSNEMRLKLMSELSGTEIGEAIYLLNYLSKSFKIEGDVCEFGVAQGATSALMANEIKGTDKNIWLFDSFEGLPKPSEKDVLKDDIFNLGSIGAYKGAMSCGEDMVKKRLEDIKFSLSRTKIVPGFIEETVNNSNLPSKVCFAYVDFDFYEPIVIALNFLDKVLRKNGFIMVDDYDFFSTGSKTAVDEFMAVNKEKYNFLLPIKSAGHFCIMEKII
jgi:O-methyltransferase